MNSRPAKPYFVGRISLNCTLAYSLGAIGVTSVSQTSTGVYLVTFASAHPAGTNYVMSATIGTAAGTAGLITVVITSSTQVTFYTYNTSGVATSAGINFISYP